MTSGFCRFATPVGGVPRPTRTLVRGPRSESSVGNLRRVGGDHSTAVESLFQSDRFTPEQQTDTRYVSYFSSTSSRAVGPSVDTNRRVLAGEVVAAEAGVTIDRTPLLLVYELWIASLLRPSRAVDGDNTGENWTSVSTQVERSISVVRSLPTRCPYRSRQSC